MAVRIKVFLDGDFSSFKFAAFEFTSSLSIRLFLARRCTAPPSVFPASFIFFRFGFFSAGVSQLAVFSVIEDSWRWDAYVHKPPAAHAAAQHGHYTGTRISLAPRARRASQAAGRSPPGAVGQKKEAAHEPRLAREFEVLK